MQLSQLMDQPVSQTDSPPACVPVCLPKRSVVEVYIRAEWAILVAQIRGGADPSLHWPPGSHRALPLQNDAKRRELFSIWKREAGRKYGGAEVGPEAGWLAGW